VHHAGVLHFVIDLADGTRGLLPEWMADPNAAKLPLVEAATLSLSALRNLRATLDGRLLSSASFNNTQEIAPEVQETVVVLLKQLLSECVPGTVKTRPADE
jgi:hypothetical protein